MQIESLCQHYLEHYFEKLSTIARRSHRLGSLSKAIIKGLPQIWFHCSDLGASLDPPVLQQSTAFHLCPGQAKWLLKRHLEAAHQKNYYYKSKSRSLPLHSRSKKRIFAVYEGINPFSSQTNILKKRLLIVLYLGFTNLNPSLFNAPKIPRTLKSLKRIIGIIDTIEWIIVIMALAS